MAARGEGGREGCCLVCVVLQSCVSMGREDLPGKLATPVSYRREILIIYNIFPCYVLAPSFSASLSLSMFFIPLVLIAFSWL